MNLREVPLLRAVLPMIIGISISLISGIRLPINFLLSILLLFTVCSILVGLTKIPYSFRWVYGIGFILFWWVMGFTLTQLHHEKNLPNHFSQFIANQNWLEGRLTDHLKVGKREYWVIEINLIADTTNIHPAGGRLLMKTPEDTTKTTPRIGDKIIATGAITPIPSPLNPNSFDFKHFMHLKNIHFVFNSNKAPRIKSTTSHFPPVLNWAKEQQHHLTHTLKQYLPETNAFAVSAALTIGNKEHLSPELKKAYANTGAMHVLAVSGLHVGLVYLLLTYLLAYLPDFNPSING